MTHSPFCLFCSREYPFTKEHDIKSRQINYNVALEKFILIFSIPPLIKTLIKIPLSERIYSKCMNKEKFGCSNWKSNKHSDSVVLRRWSANPCYSENGFTCINISLNYICKAKFHTISTLNIFSMLYSSIVTYYIIQLLFFFFT